MFKFLILLGIFACAFSANLPQSAIPQLDGRIVGGEATTINEFPWQVSLRYKGHHFCGGSIIGLKFVVTAAHCLKNMKAKFLAVRAGSTYENSGGVLVQVSDYKIHEDYNNYLADNDIGLIALSSSLPLSSTIAIIPLATSTPEHGDIGVISGWGHTFYDGTGSVELRSVKLDIVSRKQCISSSYGYSSFKVTENMLCAYTVGKDSCQGDSGGPMVSEGVLVGVVSWGHRCAEPKYPGVYTDVSVYNTWIEDTAASFEDSVK